MDLTKIVSKNKQLSLKAIGLITFISVDDPVLKKTDKSSLLIKLKEGKDAINSAFNELIDADIIEVHTTRYKGQFNTKYCLNDFYL